MQEHGCHHPSPCFRPGSIQLDEGKKQCSDVTEGLYPCTVHGEELFAWTGERLQLEHDMEEVDGGPAAGGTAVEIGR